MNYLLDTHVLMWALLDDARIAPIKDLLLNENNELFYSVVTPWEVTIKHLKNPNLMKIDGKQLSFLADQNGYKNLPITNKHINELLNINTRNSNLKHNDPFDRLLLSQAKSQGYIFLTHDKKFSNYNEKCIYLF